MSTAIEQVALTWSTGGSSYPTYENIFEQIVGDVVLNMLKDGKTQEWIVDELRRRSADPYSEVISVTYKKFIDALEKHAEQTTG